MPRRPDRLARFARRAWAAPCTALGLCLFAPALLFGGRARIVDGCIEIALARCESPRGRVHRLPFNAITFGHLVAAVSAAELRRLRRHERAHVEQYERWGPLFFVAYPAASLWQWTRGRRAYLDNVFEVQARESAGEMSAAPLQPTSRSSARATPHSAAAGEVITQVGMRSR